VLVTLRPGIDRDELIAVVLRVSGDFAFQVQDVMLRPVKFEPPTLSHSLSSSYAERDGDRTVHAEGVQIPIPTRGEFDANLDKVIKTRRTGRA